MRVPGQSSEKRVCVGAHLDTIGLIVRGFNEDGTLRVRQLGGINYASIEGETCSILCRDGSAIAGQVICNHHSVHVWAETKTDPRDEDHMSVSVIGDVKSRPTRAPWASPRAPSLASTPTTRSLTTATW